MSARYVYVYSMVDDPARVGSVGPLHAEYWHSLDLASYAGGPFADRSGGLITFVAEGPAGADAAVAGDPFVREGLLTRYSLHEWEPVDLSGQALRPTSRPVHPAVTAADEEEHTDSLPIPLQLQMIGMEQWSLLSTRSLTWTESFNRAGMFLATLSAAIIGLALAAQATSFERSFLWFALVVLAVVMFLGLATFSRLVAVNSEDALWVQGLNRLRHACLELAPGMERYFVAASHDDEVGVLMTLGAAPNVRGLYHHVFVTTPAVVGIIDAVLAASLAATIALLAGLATEWSVAVALAVFLAVVVTLAGYQLRSFDDWPQRRPPHLPTPASVQQEGGEP
jgi:hypothetical protein